MSSVVAPLLQEYEAPARVLTSIDPSFPPLQEASVAEALKANAAQGSRQNGTDPERPVGNVPEAY